MEGRVRVSFRARVDFGLLVEPPPQVSTRPLRVADDKAALERELILHTLETKAAPDQPAIAATSQSRTVQFEATAKTCDDGYRGLQVSSFRVRGLLEGLFEEPPKPPGCRCQPNSDQTNDRAAARTFPSILGAHKSACPVGVRHPSPLERPGEKCYFLAEPRVDHSKTET